MAQNKSCANCRFCVQTKQGEDTHHICHGAPPQAILKPDGGWTFVFPMVPISNPNFWCGLHKLSRGKSA